MAKKKFIDVIPSVPQYLNMLNIIIKDGTHYLDRQYALSQRHEMLQARLITKVSEDTYMAVRGVTWG